MGGGEEERQQCKSLLALLEHKAKSTASSLSELEVGVAPTRNWLCEHESKLSLFSNHSLRGTQLPLAVCVQGRLRASISVASLLASSHPVTFRY